MAARNGSHGIVFILCFFLMKITLWYQCNALLQNANAMQMALEMATTFVTEEQESVFVNPTGLEANVNHLVSYTLFPFDTFKLGDIRK